LVSVNVLTLAVSALAIKFLKGFSASRRQLMNRSFFLPVLRSSRLVLGALIIFFVVGYFIATPPTGYSMAVFNVNDPADSVDATPGDGICADSLGRCTLRAAIMEANALAGPDTINLPAGTYTLTRGPNDDEENFDGAREDIGDLDVLNGDLTIVGAGSATTIIDGGSIDRIIEVNDFAGPGAALNLSISGVTLQHGDAKAGASGTFSPGGAIQFDGFDLTLAGPSNKRLTLTDCKVTNNTASGQGGGVSVIFGSLTVTGTEISNNTSTNSVGGGVAYDAGAAATSVRSVAVSNSSFLTNRALSAAFGSGAGLQAGGNASATVENNTFNGNQAGANGGGIFTDAALAANTKAINKNKIENNSAKTGGGVFNQSGALTMTLNVVVGNTASVDSTSSGFRQGVSVSGSTATLSNNWWGCNEGPGSAPCDRASGPVGFGFGPFLVLRHAATPNTIQTNQSTSLQADFFTPSSGPPVTAGDLTALEGRAITFNNAVLGTISGAGTAISGGKANATFTAGSTAGNGSADATVDHATATASIVIQQPTGQQLTAVGPANVWIGLKNSDDVGTKFDLLAEVLKNGVVVGSGQINDVPGGSSGFNNAVLRTINMALSSGPVTLQSGDVVGFRLSVRIAATSGHVSGTARLWYNDAAANSRVNLTVDGVTTTYYLRDGFVLDTTTGPGKKTSDVTVNRNQGGNPFKPFGTWTRTF
jgi:hypothetical protein